MPSIVAQKRPKSREKAITNGHQQSTTSKLRLNRKGRQGRKEIEGCSVFLRVLCGLCGKTHWLIADG
jgi:hypothetical protein